MLAMTFRLALLLIVLVLSERSSAFVAPPSKHQAPSTHAIAQPSYRTTCSVQAKGTTRPNNDDDDDDDNAKDSIPSDVEALLQTKFPEFLALLQCNQEAMKLVTSLDNPDTPGLTLFAPNAQAFKNLGTQRLAQLQDERNAETAEKMAAYHVVGTEAIVAQRLSTEDWTQGRPPKGRKPAFTVEGITTLGGVVPVGRSAQDEGLLGTGWFAQKEGDTAVVGTNNAQVVKSYTPKSDNPKWIVHEMSALISPELLWRYCDQLRIPGF